MSNGDSAAAARQKIVDALTGAAVLHAAVDPVLLRRTLDWVIKLQGAAKRSSMELSALKAEGGALIDDVAKAGSMVDQAVREKWTFANTLAFRGPDNVIRAKSRREDKTEVLTIAPNREMGVNGVTGSSYYALSRQLAASGPAQDLPDGDAAVASVITALAVLAVDGHVDLDLLAGSGGVGAAFAGAARATGFPEGAARAGRWFRVVRRSRHGRAGVARSRREPVLRDRRDPPSAGPRTKA